MIGSHGPVKKGVFFRGIGDDQGFREKPGQPVGDALDQGGALVEGQGLVAPEARAFAARENHSGNLGNHFSGALRIVIIISSGFWHPLREQVMPVIAWRRKLSTNELR